MQYREYNDYELLNYISENNEEANEILFEKYKPLIVNISNKLYKYCKNKGLELNDLIQEGMLGLNLALKNYDQNKDASSDGKNNICMFRIYTYARKCIERKIISLVVSTCRLKHKILNDSVSFEIKTNETDVFEMVVGDNSYNPEDMMINYETETEIIEKAHNLLTDLEKQVFDLKISGFNYKEIAEILEKDPKTIDNAIQRLKQKMKKAISDK